MEVHHRTEAAAQGKPLLAVVNMTAVCLAARENADSSGVMVIVD